ncbi:MAG: hypothetical protein RL235_472 [Chlamydiota bacterium]|jgi:multiple antibiotic resistance protein
MDFTQFINHFVALLVIANPLSALSAVLRITQNQTLEEKRRTGLVSAFAVGVILLVSTWIGAPLLMIFGIRLPAFQVAGGIVLFLMSMSMLNAEESPMKQTAEEQKGRVHRDSGAIVPLAIPIIAGPGSISTIIVSVSDFPGVLNQIMLSISALLVALVIGLILYSASHLERIMGQSGINIVNRLGGLILAAISIQTIANGFIGLFPALSVVR